MFIRAHNYFLLPLYVAFKGIKMSAKPFFIWISCLLIDRERCVYVSVKSKLQHAPPGHTPGIWHLCRPGEEGIWWSESSRGWGIWSPCLRGGEFELHPRFHVKSLAWWAIMGNAVLEDFRGKDCAFVANWLRGKGLSKLCAVFKYFKYGTKLASALSSKPIGHKGTIFSTRIL